MASGGNMTVILLEPRVNTVFNKGCGFGSAINFPTGFGSKRGNFLKKEEKCMGANNNFNFKFF